MKDTKFQIQLLLHAIGNAIDNNREVDIITYPDIWNWLNDIMGELE